jgi:S1-C subfamily serine protease
MSAEDDWKIPAGVQPKPGDYSFDLERALGSVLTLRATVPPDAFTAETLGTERGGSAVLIDSDGIVLTIGYLITEASQVWLTTIDGRAVPAHVLGYDQGTGFGVVQALGRIDVPPLALGVSAKAALGDRVIVAAGGGRERAVAAQIVAKQEFAGYWEYVLPEAFFTAPAHPFWGGTAMIGPRGELLGIGSLQLPHQLGNGRVVPLNMVVPIDALKPILDDLLKFGRPNRPARPWLGLFASESEGQVVIMGLAGDGPARRAGLRAGDTVLAVAGAEVSELAEFFRAVWALGDAGVDVPLTIDREGDAFDVTVTSGDRNRYLRSPSLH